MSQKDLLEIKLAMESVLPAVRPIALHVPTFAGNEWKYVKECLDTGWVSSVGKFVDRFEQELCNYTGAKHAVAVVNGTAALHVSLKLVGVMAGDEVLIPALTFIATANAVSYCGAIPHLVDSEIRTLGLDPNKLESYLEQISEVREQGCFNRSSGARIRAVVPMHTFGHPVDLLRLIEVAKRFHIVIVEDAAESLGSYYHGTHTGNFGLIAALSFNGNKVVTTGGGGAILTNDPEIARAAKHITTTARVSHQWLFRHDQIGFNYRLPNINSALGCAQLEQLNGFVAQKRNLARRYATAFKDVGRAMFFEEPEGCKSNYWLNALILDPAITGYRDDLLSMSNLAGIMTRPVWTLMHRLTIYEKCPRMDLSVAEDLEGRIINLPSSPAIEATHA